MPKLNPKDSFGVISTGASHRNAHLITVRIPERYYKYSRYTARYFDGDIYGEPGSLHNYITYVPSGIIRESDEEDFYHYTTGYGFKSIISSNELWSSQLGKMNDSSEISYTMDLFVREVQILLNRKDEAIQIANKIKILFTKYIGKDIFIISFSRRANLLSQWCKYSDKDGVSLGISKSILSTACSGENSWQLIEVEYDHKVHVSRLKALAKKFLKKKILDLPSNELDTWFYESCLDTLQKYVCSMKHAAFKEEEELRLVKHIVPSSNELKNRPLDNRKYIPLKLLDLFNKDDSADTNFGYVISGPSDDYKAKMEDIYSHFRLNETKFFVILDSGIPYVWPE